MNISKLGSSGLLILLKGEKPHLPALYKCRRSFSSSSSPIEDQAEQMVIRTDTILDDDSQHQSFGLESASFDLIRVAEPSSVCPHANQAHSQACLARRLLQGCFLTKLSCTPREGLCRLKRAKGRRTLWVLNSFLMLFALGTSYAACRVRCPRLASSQLWLRAGCICLPHFCAPTSPHCLLRRTVGK